MSSADTPNPARKVGRALGSSAILESCSALPVATVLGIDLQGVFHMSKSCLPHLKKTGATDGAVIINITATLGDSATPAEIRAALEGGIALALVELVAQLTHRPRHAMILADDKGHYAAPDTLWQGGPAALELLQM